MNQSIRGKLITLEGSEGGGKSSHIGAIEDLLTEVGKTVVVTREPGGTAVAERIRSVLLDPETIGISADTETLLMFAARADHITQVVAPALDRGDWVVCDRFTDATYAYQGGGRGIPDERIETLEQWVQGDLRPDLVLILDLDVKLGLERIHTRGQSDRFERERLEFFARVREKYLARARVLPNQYRIIDASASLEQVRASILSAVRSLL